MTQTNVGAAAGTSQTLDLLADLSIHLGVTVMRTHLTICTIWGAVGVAAPAQYTFGLKCADSVEIGSPPGVPTNSHLDWALFKQVYAKSTSGTIDTVTVHEYDVRAKRKIEELQQTWGLFFTNGTSVALTYGVTCRTLLALP